ncbi:Histidine kinase [Rhodovastum atsumiense]|nr:PAS domain-containing sensor histidine kinase [Rhodovastum atsumiense]CAH2599381.1 Histidine kinase [Rhodovastum atsumiense]
MPPLAAVEFRIWLYGAATAGLFAWTVARLSWRTEPGLLQPAAPTHVPRPDGRIPLDPPPSPQPLASPITAPDPPMERGNVGLDEAVRQRIAELAASEAGYRTFFDHAEDSLCEIEVTADGRFLCRNINPHAEHIMGVSAAAIRGMTAEQILGADAGARIIAALQRCVAEGALRYEETWPTPQGPRITDTSMVPLRDGPDGRVSRVLCSMRDITERRDLEQRLAQAQKMQALGQLAGGIAHDFNNVLQAIEGGASLILRQSGQRETVERLARIVVDAAGRGSAITRRLLAFARRGELRAEPVEAALLLAELREVLAPTLGAAITVCAEVAPGLPALLADKGQLETVLVNLATNARDAMPEGGRLTLTAQPETAGTAHPAGLQPGHYVRLQVTDTGCGMDAQTLARVGEPFFTTKPAGKGTGLGLSMARGFAEQSGGAMAVHSTPGLGTTVTLWLPSPPPAATTGSAATPQDEPLPAQAPVAAHRILVVDDDPLVREMLCASLEDLGYAVQAEADAAAALARLDTGLAVDVLLTDFCMPGTDGLALIREARLRRPDLPAVLSTGYAGDSAPPFSGGGVPPRCTLLQKPFSLETLRDRLATVLGDGTTRPPS